MTSTLTFREIARLPEFERDLKGGLKGRGANSGLRLVYAHFEAMDKIELVEIYFKGDKENEDRGRILRNYR
jgi:hypothetical protein